MRTYVFLFIIDAIALLIALYFFAEGLGDGTVSSVNIALWLGILSGLSAPILAGWYLRTREQIVAANLVLAVVAVPAILAGLFVISLLISQPRWN
jgi:hypothetical protein